MQRQMSSAPPNLKKTNKAHTTPKGRTGFLYNYFIKKNVWQIYLLALIPLAAIVIFYYIPMGGVVIAFKDFSARKGIWGSDWAGIKYFQQLFNTPIFMNILKNTLVLSVYSLVVGFPFPIILALAFNEISNVRLKKVFQTITFAPYFISTIVAVSIVLQMFSYRYGVVNAVMKLLGFPALDFTGMTEFFRPAYVWSGVWQGAGYSSVLYIAALSGIDVSLYEAAAIDGATKFQKTRYIDLPGIAPTIIITLILNAGSLLSVGFEKVFLFQNPVNYGVSEIISTYVYKIGITQAQFSFATAVGVFNSVVNCFILLLVNLFAKKISDTSLF